jgi:hypothetical protein
MAGPVAQGGKDKGKGKSNADRRALVAIVLQLNQ